MGTINLDARVAVSGTGFSREGASSGATSSKGLIVPTLCVGMHPETLRVIPDRSTIYFPGVSVRRCLP
ncbi:hypothetical protein FX982_00344 [Pseudomonas graminis]|uniref:Uncharacterized protein n=1 Tax=Pseudomonas graminis TaxID=158627 RepID=A0A6M8MLH0_9PSED|nr:hypothetical protein FX982_00344 [Pseudomonas graminis]